MPTATNDGVELYYETAGEGETVAFVGEAGYGAWQWGWQHRRVTGPYRTVVWDLRGTGNSDAPSGPYDVETLAADLESVLADIPARRVHLVGAGLGGMVALRHAREYGRSRTLTLFNTTATGTAINKSVYRELFAPGDDRTALRASLTGAFSQAFRSEQSSLVERICEWRMEEDAGRDAREAQVEAALSFDAGPLYELTHPTLVCHGLDDPAVPIEAGRTLAADLPNATFEAVEGRHLCFVEHARSVTDRLLDFLDEYSPDR